MGFNMHCKNTGKCCPYSMWFDQRIGIILATIKFLEQKIEEVEAVLSKYDQDLQGDQEPFETTNITVDRYYDSITKLKTDLIDPIRQIQRDERSEFLRDQCIFNVVAKAGKMKDALTTFNVYGLWVLCSQGDCSGIYSMGDSYDIVCLLEMLEPWMKTDAEFSGEGATMYGEGTLYEKIYTFRNECSDPILEIFRESVNIKCPVRVT